MTALLDDLYPRIVDAHRALRPQVMVTPLTRSPMLSRLTGCEVYLKCEHVQHTGSFKFRGASNKLRLLDPAARQQGVATVSTGNHGQGVALAGKLAGVPVTVYASSSAARVKLDAIADLGAKVITLDAPTLEVELEAARRARAEGKPFIPPYNDLDVIAGQGTVGMEILEQCPEVDAVYASVGGGGLISGIGTAIKQQRPQIRVVGCWPQNSTALYQSLRAGQIIEVEEWDTISDGTAGGVEPGSVTLPICQQVIDDTALVTEDEIKAAMALLARSDRWIVEGAAGVALAALLKQAPQQPGRTLVAVLCGRNIQLSEFIQAVS